ncbi:nucleoside phosphatase family-domain-containing protein [Tribonema minus]|uniref:Nucleoside phosphatase family-domain-containing protein n=1 Tax=Tribonema minus TaxID=303371 RepID=A0A835ZFV4_9STRA|nr:nucleoside phosphatase family-domain-containing protein [Tribonema minus]
MIIDAGSGGSRMHVYTWSPRLFDTLPPPISFPESSNAWTGRFSPGISSYADHPEDIGEHLGPLIDFAIDILADKKGDFWKFPIFLKATGGMRQLPFAQRDAIMTAIRQYLYGDDCPFYFEFEYARVISGEEESIYAWAAINFLRGHLLLDSGGAGTANSNVTVGALDMGGASTQIAFFRQDQDIMSNLFKLQRHLAQQPPATVRLRAASGELAYVPAHPMDEVTRLRYARSSSSGTADAAAVAGASPGASSIARQAPGAARRLARRARGHGGGAAGELDAVFAERGAAAEGGALGSAPALEMAITPVVTDACLPAGAALAFTAADGVEYNITATQGGSGFDACHAQVLPLLHKALNTWCNYAHSQQCSIAGVYQPAIPLDDSRQFYAFSGYYRAWTLMQLPEGIALGAFLDQTRVLCSLDQSALEARNRLAGKPLKGDEIAATCFLATYCITLLIEGYGFSLNTTVHFVKNYNGYKVGWALGSMLYEINALPWKYTGPGSPDYVANVEQEAECRGVLMLALMLAELQALQRPPLWQRQSLHNCCCSSVVVLLQRRRQ